MAKGQKRSNREIKKPKADKPKPAVAAESSAAKGLLAQTGKPKNNKK